MIYNFLLIIKNIYCNNVDQEQKIQIEETAFSLKLKNIVKNLYLLNNLNELVIFWKITDATIVDDFLCSDIFDGLKIKNLKIVIDIIYCESEYYLQICDSNHEKYSTQIPKFINNELFFRHLSKIQTLESFTLEIRNLHQWVPYCLQKIFDVKYVKNTNFNILNVRNIFTKHTNLVDFKIIIKTIHETKMLNYFTIEPILESIIKY